MMRFVLALVLAIGVPLPAVAALPVERVVSPGGIEAWLISDDSMPIIALSFSFDGGTSTDPAGKEGRANLASSLLNEGAGPYESAVFRKELADLSIGMSFGAGLDRLTGSLTTVTDNADRAFDLLALAMQEPRLDAPEIERMRTQIETGIRRRVGRPNWLSTRAFYDVALPGHPYSRPSRGSIETLTALTVEDLRSYLDEQLVRSRLVIGVAGDISAEELGERLDQIFGPLPEGQPAKNLTQADLRASGRTVLVDHHGPQSVLYLAQPGISREDPDFFAAVVMNYIMGGGISSRLNTELREKRGLTYGISSGLVNLERAEFISISADVANEDVPESLALIRAEWDRMATEGATQQEVDDAIAYITGSFPLGLTSTGSIAGALHSYQVLGRGIDYLEKRNDYIRLVDKAAVDRVAARLLNSDELITVVTGTPPESVAADIVLNADALARRELSENGQ